MTRDFWLACGHHLLDRSAGGGLVVTPEYLRAYLARPELVPPADACAAERALHESLLADPERTVTPAEIAAIADADARENWELMIAFRDRLLAHPTLEAAYLHLVRHGMGRTPPLFVDQLAHVILRNILDGGDDPLVLRAAEMFFRVQRLTVQDGALIAADEETIAKGRPLSPLVSILGLPAGVEIDVLNPANAESYWARSDRFDMALDLTAGHEGLVALGSVIRRWLAHLVGIDAAVEPLVAIKDVRLTWYVGLDAEGTRIGDALWNGEALDRGTENRIVALYRLDIHERVPLLEGPAAGEPIYLILAMAPDMTLRLKPQNLVAGLPLRQPAAAQ